MKSAPNLPLKLSIISALLFGAGMGCAMWFYSWREQGVPIPSAIAMSSAAGGIFGAYTFLTMTWRQWIDRRYEFLVSTGKIGKSKRFLMFTAAIEVGVLAALVSFATMHLFNNKLFCIISCSDDITTTNIAINTAAIGVITAFLSATIDIFWSAFQRKNQVTRQNQKKNDD